MALPKARVLGSALGSRASEVSEAVHFRCPLSQKEHRTWMRRLIDEQQILDKNGTGEISCGDGGYLQGEIKAEAR